MASEPLTSWKAIAAVFGRDVRTVQRWEKEEGLPVHRHLHRHRPTVWADREELDAWWKQRGSMLPDTEPAGPAEAETTSEFAETPNAERPGRRPVLRYAAIGALALTLAAAGSISPGRSHGIPYEPVISIIGSIPAASTIEVRAFSDLNADGADDIVVHPAASNEVRIYLGPHQQPAQEPDVRITVPGQRHVQATPVGDVDGDGLRDLIVSVMYGEPETYHGTGPSYLLRGRKQWPLHVELPHDAAATFRVDPGPDIRLTAYSADDGIDLNGDGLADLVMGGADYSTPTLRSPGGVFVFWGRRTWPSEINVAAADVTVTGSYDGHGLAPWCAAGDFNADGLTDLALVATDAALWYLRGGRGAVFLFEGRTVWPRRLDAMRDATFVMPGSTSTMWSTYPRLADVNGDGADDLVTAMAALDERGPGRVAVVFGGKNRTGLLPERDADVLIQGPAQFGYALAAADLDADGRNDLIVGDRGAGTLHVIPGRREWQRRGHPSDFSGVVFASAGKRIGTHGLAVGDADGDGAPDIALDAGADAVGVMKPGLPLLVDVRPNVAAPNVLVPGGVVSIAVRLPDGSEDELDVGTLRVAGEAPSHVAANGDRTGIQIYFDVDRLRLRPDATRLSVIGRTRSGIPVSGSDSIVIPAAVPASVR